LFALIDDLNTPNRITGTQERQTLEALLKHHSFSLLPSKYAHSKSIAAFNGDNKLISFLIGSANITYNAFATNLETGLVLEGNSFLALSREEKENIEDYYYHGIAGFDTPRQNNYTYRRSNAEQTQRLIEYLERMGGVESRDKGMADATTGQLRPAFTFSRRYNLEKGEKGYELSGLDISIREVDAFTGGYSFSLTVGQEYKRTGSGKGEYVPVVYLSKNNRVINGMIYVNHSKEVLRLVDGTELAQGEAREFDSFAVVTGLIHTMSHMMTFESSRGSLQLAVAQLTESNRRQALDKILGKMLYTEAIANNMLNLGDYTGERFTELMPYIQQLRGVSRDRKSLILQNLINRLKGQLVESSLYVQNPNYLETRRTNISSLSVVENNIFRTQNSAISEAGTILNKLDLIMISSLQKDDTAALYSDLFRLVVGQDDVARSFYKRHQESVKREMFSQITSPFMQPHELGYNFGQALYKKPVFGINKELYDLAMFQDTMGFLLSPHPLKHNEPLNVGGRRFIRGKSDSRYFKEPNLYKNLGGIYNVDEGATPIKDIESIMTTLRGLGIIDKEQYRQRLILAYTQANTTGALSADQITALVESQVSIVFSLSAARKENQERLLYFPFRVVEQISERLRTQQSGRPVDSASREFGLYADTMGVVGNLDMLNYDRMINADFLTNLPPHQFNILQNLIAEITAENPAFNHGQVMREALRRIKEEIQADPLSLVRGFVGGVKPKRVIQSMGISTMSDYAYVNQGYQYETGGVPGERYTPEYVMHHRTTLTLDAARLKSNVQFQALVRKTLKKGVTFLAKESLIENTPLIQELQQKVLDIFNQSFYSRAVAAGGQVQESDISNLMSTMRVGGKNRTTQEIQSITARINEYLLKPNASATTLPTGVTFANIKNLTDRQRKILELIMELSYDSVRYDSSSGNFYFRTGVYSTAQGTSILERLSSINRIGRFNEGSQYFTLDGFYEYITLGDSKNTTTQFIKFKLPATSQREYRGISFLEEDAVIDHAGTSTISLELKTGTRRDMVSNLRPGTDTAKGPSYLTSSGVFDLIEQEQRQRQVDGTGTTLEDLLPQRLKSQNIYAILSPSQVKGFNFEQGLMLIEDNNFLNFLKSRTGTGDHGGVKIAEGLALMMLGETVASGTTSSNIGSLLGNRFRTTNRLQAAAALSVNNSGKALPDKQTSQLNSITGSLQQTFHVFGELGSLALPRLLSSTNNVKQSLIQTVALALGSGTAAEAQEAQQHLQLASMLIFNRARDTTNAIQYDNRYIFNESFDSGVRTASILALFTKFSQDLFVDINTQSRLSNNSISELNFAYFSGVEGRKRWRGNVSNNEELETIVAYKRSLMRIAGGLGIDLPENVDESDQEAVRSFDLKIFQLNTLYRFNRYLEFGIESIPSKVAVAVGMQNMTKMEGQYTYELTKKQLPLYTNQSREYTDHFNIQAAVIMLGGLMEGQLPDPYRASSFYRLNTVNLHLAHRQREVYDYPLIHSRILLQTRIRTIHIRLREFRLEKEREETRLNAEIQNIERQIVALEPQIRRIDNTPLGSRTVKMYDVQQTHLRLLEAQRELYLKVANTIRAYDRKHEDYLEVYNQSAIALRNLIQNPILGTRYRAEGTRRAAAASNPPTLDSTGFLQFTTKFINAYTDFSDKTLPEVVKLGTVRSYTASLAEDAYMNYISGNYAASNALIEKMSAIKQLISGYSQNSLQDQQDGISSRRDLLEQVMLNQLIHDPDTTRLITDELTSIANRFGTAMSNPSYLNSLGLAGSTGGAFLNPGQQQVLRTIIESSRNTRIASRTSIMPNEYYTRFFERLFTNVFTGVTNLTDYQTNRASILSALNVQDRLTTELLRQSGAYQHYQKELEDRILAAQNDDPGSQYLSAIDFLRTRSLSAINFGNETNVEERFRSRGVLETVTRTRRLVLPQIQVLQEVPETQQFLVTYGATNKMPVAQGLILGSDILQKLSLVYQTQSSKALSVQRELSQELESNFGLLKRITVAAEAGNAVIISRVEYDKYIRLINLLNDSIIETFNLLRNQETIRQAGGERMKVTGISSIAMSSLLIGENEIVAGKRFFDAIQQKMHSVITPKALEKTFKKISKLYKSNKHEDKQEALKIINELRTINLLLDNKPNNKTLAIIDKHLNKLIPPSTSPKVKNKVKDKDLELREIDYLLKLISEIGDSSSIEIDKTTDIKDIENRTKTQLKDISITKQEEVRAMMLRQGAPYSSSLLSQTGTVLKLVKTVDELARRARQVGSLVGPDLDEKGNNTLMLLSSLGSHYTQMGDYDGDSFQTSITQLAQITRSIQQKTDELAKLQTKEREQKHDRNITPQTSRNYYRSQARRIRRQVRELESQRLEMIMEYQKVKDTALERGREGIRKFSSIYTAIPDELLSEDALRNDSNLRELLSGGESLQSFVKQYRDTLGGTYDNTVHVQNTIRDLNADNLSRLHFNYDASTNRFNIDSASLASLGLNTQRQTDLINLFNQYQQSIEPSRLSNIVAQSDIQRREQELREAIIEVQSNAANISAAVSTTISKGLNSAMGSVLDDQALTELQSILGSSGGSLLGTTYNTLIPLVAMQLGEVAAQKSLFKTRDNQAYRFSLIAAINQRIREINSIPTTSPQLIDEVNTLYDRKTRLYANEVSVSDRIRYERAQKQVDIALRFVITTQQFLRDAGLKPKEAKTSSNRPARALLEVAGDYTLTEDEYRKYGIPIQDQVIGLSNILSRVTGTQQQQGEYRDEIMTKFLTTQVGSNLSLTDPTTQQSVDFQTIRAFGALKLVTEYVGGKFQTPNDMFENSILKQVLESAYDTDTYNTLTKDQFIPRFIGDLYAQFQTEYIVNSVLELENRVEFSSKGNLLLNYYGIQIDSSNNVQADLDNSRIQAIVDRERNRFGTITDPDEQARLDTYLTDYEARIRARAEAVRRSIIVSTTPRPPAGTPLTGQAIPENQRFKAGFEASVTQNIQEGKEDFIRGLEELRVFHQTLSSMRKGEVPSDLETQLGLYNTVFANRLASGKVDFDMWSGFFAEYLKEMQATRERGAPTQSGLYAAGMQGSSIEGEGNEMNYVSTPRDRKQLIQEYTTRTFGLLESHAEIALKYAQASRITIIETDLRNRIQQAGNVPGGSNVSIGGTDIFISDSAHAQSIINDPVTFNSYVQQERLALIDAEERQKAVYVAELENRLNDNSISATQYNTYALGIAHAYRGDISEEQYRAYLSDSEVMVNLDKSAVGYASEESYFNTVVNNLNTEYINLIQERIRRVDTGETTNSLDQRISEVERALQLSRQQSRQQYINNVFGADSDAVMQELSDALNPKLERLTGEALDKSLRKEAQSYRRLSAISEAVSILAIPALFSFVTDPGSFGGQVAAGITDTFQSYVTSTETAGTQEGLRAAASFRAARIRNSMFYGVNSTESFISALAFEGVYQASSALTARTLQTISRAAPNLTQGPVGTFVGELVGGVIGLTIANLVTNKRAGLPTEGYTARDEADIFIEQLVQNSRASIARAAEVQVELLSVTAEDENGNSIFSELSETDFAEPGSSLNRFEKDYVTGFLSDFSGNINVSIDGNDSPFELSMEADYTYQSFSS